MYRIPQLPPVSWMCIYLLSSWLNTKSWRELCCSSLTFFPALYKLILWVLKDLFFAYSKAISFNCLSKKLPKLSKLSISNPRKNDWFSIIDFKTSAKEVRRRSFYPLYLSVVCKHGHLRVAAFLQKPSDPCNAKMLSSAFQFFGSDIILTSRPH